MIYRYSLFSLLILMSFVGVHGQNSKLAFRFTGIVYDENYIPLPYTHVIASGTGEGDMTDSLGIFTLYIRENDKLSFYNITRQDAVVSVNKNNTTFFIKLKQRVYLIPEARIFNWGSTYDEFIDEVNRQGVPQSRGAEIGLPQQDPDAIPFDLDEKKIKSAKFFFSSPVSYLYHNLSKYEKSVRKAYKLDKDREFIEAFEAILSSENISKITDLKGKELETFMIYLNSNLSCNYFCGEIELYSEILTIWEKYHADN
jgi:hypothetical protein